MIDNSDLQERLDKSGAKNRLNNWTTFKHSMSILNRHTMQQNGIS